ncbi:MAG TPA: MopE-related protein, partial [Nitrososphaera sp.]
MTLPGNSATTPGGSWWIKNVADQTTDDGKEARNLVARMQQPQTQPFFYALGLHAHNPFTPGLTYWNLNGDPSVQDLLPVDKKGTITNLTGNGSEPIVIPATPPNDRADVPPIALTVQILKSDYEWKKTIHAYDGEVAQMDVQLGLILDEMDRQNLWSNTVVVFWGDHGQHLGEHEGTWLKNTLFEESLHTPLIVYVPGKPGGECSKLVELVDLYSTLAELCELPVPSGMEGSSFVKLLDNPNTEWKRAVFSQVKRGTLTARSVRTGQYHYNSWGANGEELYDHDTDPHEYINLAKNFQYASVLNDMRTILTEGWTKSTPPLQCTDPQTFYADNDGDSYGNSSNFVQACSKPQGFVTDNTDCNDGNADIHPGATEVCNGIDDNCDGQVDDGDICNIDNDLDGYTPAEGDCNDNNANINPSAVEVCGNSLDDNCNGQVDEGCGGTCTNATGLATTNITSKSVTFNWTASVNPTVWQIQYKKAVAGATWINIRPQGSARSANISSLTANQTYKWHIHAKCGTTWTTYSSLQSFKTLSALQSTFAEGVMAKEPSLLLYPNPSTGEITIAHKSLSSGKLL